MNEMIEMAICLAINGDLSLYNELCNSSDVIRITVENKYAEAVNEGVLQ